MRQQASKATWDKELKELGYTTRRRGQEELRYHMTWIGKHTNKMDKVIKKHTGNEPDYINDAKHHSADNERSSCYLLDALLSTRLCHASFAEPMNRQYFARCLLLHWASQSASASWIWSCTGPELDILTCGCVICWYVDMLHPLLLCWSPNRLPNIHSNCMVWIIAPSNHKNRWMMRQQCWALVCQTDCPAASPKTI
jgi:hypothetical protein